MGKLVKLAASRELHAYWSLLRGARSAPERSEIDPSAIRGILADTFILEACATKRYPFRVAGTRTNALFLDELRGRPFLDLWRAADQGEMAALLGGVSDEAAPLVAGVSTSQAGGQRLELELLLLPLRHHGKTHSRILGAVSPARLPSWIGLAPAAPLSLASLRMLERPQSPPGQAILATAEEAGQPPGFSRAPDIERFGHLFVVADAQLPQ